MAIKVLSRKSKRKKLPKQNEEKTSNFNNGVIKFDTDKLQLPTQLIEEQGEMDKPFWQIEPIIIAIFILAIAFIGFITLLISRMPLPAK